MLKYTDLTIDYTSYNNEDCIIIKGRDVVEKAEANFINIKILAEYFNLEIKYSKALSRYTLKGVNRLLYLEQSYDEYNYTTVLDESLQDAYISSFTW